MLLFACVVGFDFGGLEMFMVYGLFDCFDGLGVMFCVGVR